MSKFRLDGKVALVTGGASGIGNAVSRVLAEQGAAVAVHYFNSASAAEAVVAAAKIAGRKAVGIQADLSKPGEADRVVTATIKELGGLDILVNNAGFLVQRCPVAEMSDELFRTIMDVNLTSTFWMCRAALRHMLSKASGSIVNMSSAAAFAGGGNGATIYAASKAAVVGFTRALAKEVGPQGHPCECRGSWPDRDAIPRPVQHTRRPSQHREDHSAGPRGDGGRGGARRGVPGVPCGVFCERRDLGRQRRDVVPLRTRAVRPFARFFRRRDGLGYFPEAVAFLSPVPLARSQLPCRTSPAPPPLCRSSKQINLSQRHRRVRIRTMSPPENALRSRYEITCTSISISLRLLMPFRNVSAQLILLQRLTDLARRRPLSVRPPAARTQSPVAHLLTVTPTDAPPPRERRNENPPTQFGGIHRRVRRLPPSRCGRACCGIWPCP